MLYNVYRPTDFSEVKGQEDVLLTLQKQSETQKFGHAYLLAGHRGTGKTTIARILSKAVNCENPSINGPCKICASCLAARESLDILELDAASNNGVDKIKEMMAQAKYRPVQLKNKVFIIDEVHNLSASAFDVLLKPLEEPSSFCIFILCTTELHKIPVTVRSRCEEYVFHPIGAAPMRERLQEVLKDQNAACEDDALNLIIRNANGGLRDALGLLEQLLVSTNGNITSEFAKKSLGILDTDRIIDTLECIICMDTLKALNCLDCLLQDGKSPSLIVETTLNVMTDIITLKSTQSRESVVHSREYIEKLFQLSAQISFERLYWMCEQYCTLRSVIRGSVNPALDIRLTVIRLSSHEIINADPVSLAEEISCLKREISFLKQKAGSVPIPPGSNAAVIKPFPQESALQGSTPESEGFFSLSDASVPFGGNVNKDFPKNDNVYGSGNTGTPHERYDSASSEQEKETPTSAQKEVMPADRTEAEAVFGKENAETKSQNTDISASDLFKMLA